VTGYMPTTTAADNEPGHARVALLPVGSFEQHGPCLPFTTDTVIACLISQEIARAYSAFMLAPVTISCSHEHAAWRGTVSVSTRTLIAIVDDVYQSVTASGFESLILINAHGGNYVLANLVQEGTAQGKRIALFPGKEDWKQARRAGGLATSDHEDMHAGELETSILLHASPELVRHGYGAADWTADDRRDLLTAGMRAYTSNGIIGRPSLATPEKGKAVLASLTEDFARALEALASIKDG
jgi:creatinine amidohydrolase